MHDTIARGEHQHVQVPIYQAKGLVAALEVAVARVFSKQCRAPVKLLSQVEGKAAFGYVALAFGWIVGETNVIIVST